MAGGWVWDISGLMKFLERMAGGGGETLIDLHMSALIATRADRKSQMQVNNLAGAKSAEIFRHGELALLRDLQIRYHPSPMPTLAKWAAGRLRPGLERWRNKPRREGLQARLDVVAQTGLLARLMELTDDPGARAMDAAGAIRAEMELAAIDAEVAAIDDGDKLRFADAERFGQAITGGVGLSVLILVAMSVLL